LLKFYKTTTLANRYYLALIISFEQKALLCNFIKKKESISLKLEDFLSNFKEIDSFYAAIGGITAYYLTFLNLLKTQKKTVPPSSKVTYLQPPFIDLRSSSTKDLVLEGLQSLPNMVEIYPIGGAGDRLGLVDETSGEPLPVAKLNYRGKTLLQRLIEDLQAREYLYYKTFGKQVITPIVLMTSQEKNNDTYIREICRKHNWFGRGEENFTFVMQPLVPVIDEEGNWVLSSPFSLSKKPGGHGVLWYLLKTKGVLDKQIKQKRTKALIRQINNPIAGTDQLLLALLGAGTSQNKTFGFVACQRLVQAAEGVDILIQRETKEGLYYSLRNIEYTDFEKNKILDIPESPGSNYSSFPANTNILFADLEKIAPYIDRNPFPGALINLKQKTPSQSNDSFVFSGRLEATMQNIIDFEEEKRLSPPQEPEDLKNSFILYNERRKTLSATKTLMKADKSPVGTPESCLYDELLNAYDLLTKHCFFALPKLPSFEDFLKTGPSFMLAYLPALGPLYSEIGKKIKKGRFNIGSFLELDIATVHISELNLDGHLSIKAINPLGSNKSQKQLEFNNYLGSCYLDHVTIKTAPFHQQRASSFWKNSFQVKENVSIVLHGHSEFKASNITLTAPFHIEVPNGFRYTAYTSNKQIMLKKTKLS
jgi:UTP---glucose-1-phosphate uridylyltransferase